MSLASDVRLCLSQWITQLLEAVPIRSRATFVELLCACMISPEGWVTRAIGALLRKKHWTTYYKLIERGYVEVLPIARAVLALILQIVPEQVLTFVVDDTLVPRTSATAPGCSIRHDHATPERIAALPVQEYRLSLYGKEQRIRLRSTIAVVRFLKGAPVRALWCQFFDPDKDAWTKPRLLLASELDLGALDVVHIYARRWGIEPLFHNLKRWWGASNLWQQSQVALELWMQIRSTAWVLAQLLTFVVAKAFPMQAVAPWRTGHALTAGLVAQWMRIEFTGLAFRDGFNKKSQKFSFPAPRNDPRIRDWGGQSP